MRQFSIGVDYGTNSVRAVVVDAADGAELAGHVYDYPSGKAGILLDHKTRIWPGRIRRITSRVSAKLFRRR